VELAYDYQPAASLRTDDFVRLVEKRKIADPTAADVRVMTIHQAKGLEFDIVVLPELDGSLTGQTPPLVVGRPGPTQPIDVVCRYANEHVRRFLPPRLQTLFEEDVRRTVSESLCVLYVAMTRAVHALHMILPPPRPNERSMPKTFAGLLRATLAPGDATASLLYEHGDAKWHAHCRERPLWRSGEPSVDTSDPGPPKITLAPAHPDRDRGLGRTSPSALEGGQRIPAARLLESKALAFEHGDLVHACLAELKWLDEGWPPKAQLAAAARRKAPRIAADAKLLDSKLKALRGQVDTAAIAAVLRRAYYDSPRNLGFADPALASWKPGEITLEVHTERPFAIRDGDEILTGSIDRLVLIRRGGKLLAADVLDFKTDAIPPDNPRLLQERIAFYSPQLEAYRKAVARTFHLEPRRITSRLLFLSAAIVCPVT
jgi:ATP-dependent exoDNAse (exonuclease V) beta subunit